MFLSNLISSSLCRLFCLRFQDGCMWVFFRHRWEQSHFSGPWFVPFELTLFLPTSNGELEIMEVRRHHCSHLLELGVWCFNIPDGCRLLWRIWEEDWALLLLLFSLLASRCPSAFRSRRLLLTGNMWCRVHIFWQVALVRLQFIRFSLLVHCCDRM